MASEDGRDEGRTRSPEMGRGAWLQALRAVLAIALLAAGIYGFTRDGHLDGLDLLTGGIGVLTALWFYRER